MNNSTEPAIEKADVSRIKGISGLWLIPLITIAVGAWMVYDHWANQGPLITITFSSAEGLAVEKTKIKTRNVEVGKVVDISLNEDLDGVKVTARMSHEVRDMLADDSSFWLVQPTIGFSGVSGLSTIFSGQYIEFLPGKNDNIAEHFEGLDAPPLTPPGTPGLHVTLHTHGDFSFKEGDVILYKGFNVGQIEKVDINLDKRMIYYDAFIRAPYHELITTNTRFWKMSGISAEVTADGITLQAGTIQSLLQGGIAFSVPENERLGKRITEHAEYHIYPSQSAINEKHYDHSLRYVLLVNSNERGLSPGAPIYYRGIHVGKVLRSGDIEAGQHLLEQSMKIPVVLEVYPGSFGLEDSIQGKLEAEKHINQQLTEGLSATIKVSNFILGQQLIEINLPSSSTKQSKQHKINYHNNLVIIPVTLDGISHISAQLSELIEKINNLPLESVGKHAVQLLAQSTQTLHSIEKIAADMHDRELIASLNGTLHHAQELMSGFTAESSTNQELKRALATVADAFAELKPLLTQLKNKPDALIFSSDAKNEPEPTRKAN
ncbi:paraquat-inducible protein B [Nitrosomonas aestuarii]|uniref:Paraquat-inducible protein B n=1 Tax=Nitrosomonas aestuarii TaxID=52441 RepID=A0A1I3ZXZ3_9PROT|nr:intermembrane transport protein PqiB [Nitrosomonas aestuarii]SFK48409.1 paraquat-inducible protein B [Nitrosomonas aestuarii]